MNRKRVLALLLAVSMTVPSNVVFAAEPEAETTVENIAEAVEADTAETEEETVEDATETVDEVATDETEASDEAEEVIEEQPEEASEELIEGEADVPELQSVTVDKSTWSDYFSVEAGKLQVKDADVLKKTETVVIPASVSEIPTGIFDKSSGPKVVKFETREGNPDAAETLTIAANAFKGTSVQYIDDIPAGLTKLANRTFYGATNLKGITFEDISTLTEIGKEVLKGSGIEELDLRGADNLDTIAEKAFSGAKYLKTIYWVTSGDAAQEIPTEAFSDCDKLVYVYLGTDVESVGARAFKSCDDLATINLPENVTSIGSEAFAECKSLKRVYFRNAASASGDCATEIAQDAFPSRGTNLMVYGYDGTALKCAENMGFDFRTLHTKYAVSTSVNNSDLGSIEVSKESARPGDIIEIRIVRGEKSYIDKNSITINGEAIEDVAELVRTTDTEMVYDYYMPSMNVKVYAAFKEDASSGKLAVRADVDGNDVTWEEKVTSKDKVEYYLHFSKAGLTTPLTFYRNGQKLASGEMTFSSSNTNVVAVSKDGIARSTGWGNVKNKPGTYWITAEIKDGESVKIYVTVGGEKEKEVDKDASAYTPVTDETEVTFDFDGREFDSNKAFATSDGIYYDVRYPNYKLAVQERSFDVWMNVGDDDQIVDAEWKVVDGGIASVAYSSTTDNHNRITVKKDAEGETAIVVTIKSLQYNETKKKVETVKTTRTITLEVYDPTPRLEDDVVTLYKNQENPAVVTLVPVYEIWGTTSSRAATKNAYDISKLENVKVQEMTKKNNDEVYTDIKGLAVNYNEDSEQFEIATTSGFAKQKVGTYSKKWYITGNYKGETKTFHIQIPTVKVAEAMTTPAAILSETKKTVYQGIKNPSFYFEIVDKKTKELIDLPSDAQIKVVSNKGGEIASEDLDDAVYVYEPTSLKAETLTLTVSSSYWTKPLTLKYSISVAQKLAKLKYSTTKLTFAGEKGEAGVITVDESLLVAQNVGLKNITSDDQHFTVDYDEDEGIVTVTANNVLTAKSYKLNLIAETDGGEKLPVQAVTIAVVDATKKLPGVAVKTAGSINVLDATSSISCTPTFANIGNKYTAVEVTGQDADKFEIDEFGRLTAKDGADLNVKQKYSVTLTYTVNGKTVVSKAIAIKLVNTQPTVTFDKTKVTMFAGQRYSDKGVDLTATKKTFKGANIVGYTFAKNTSDAMKAAFTLTAKSDANNGLIVKLDKPGRLRLNKNYTLKIVPVYEGQSVETAAAQNKAVSVVVNLKK